MVTMQPVTQVQRRCGVAREKLRKERRSRPFIGRGVVGLCSESEGPPTNRGRETSECVPYKETDPAKLCSLKSDELKDSMRNDLEDGRKTVAFSLESMYRSSYYSFRRPKVSFTSRQLLFLLFLLLSTIARRLDV